MESMESNSGGVNESNSNEQCQILVRIVEARQLVGNDIDPFVQVAIGPQIRTTKSKRSANDAVFEEDFVFDFLLPKVVFLQNIISITALSDGGLFRSNKIIGCFKIDAATVHAQAAQGFYRKWAMLLDPDDPMSGPKGYVKCDIVATVAGQSKRPAKPPPPAVDEDDIEGNLLVPDEASNIFGERQPAKFVISIFRAESLPSLNSTVMFSSMKKALVGPGPKSLVNPYVQVSFAGRTGRTKVIKHDANPEWNQEIVFVELFPSLVKTFRIHVRDEAGAMLATTLLDLDTISDNGASGYLPTFGPAYVNLYGDFRSNIDSSPLNYGLGEGLAYRGRLCLAVRVELLEFFPRKGMHKVDVVNCPGPTEELLGEWQDFNLFGTIFDATMIEKKYATKTLHFELSLGEFGSFEDAAAQPSTKDKDKSKSMESLMESERSSGIASSLSGSIMTLVSATHVAAPGSSVTDVAADYTASEQSTVIDKTAPVKAIPGRGEFCHIDYGLHKPYFNVSLAFQYHSRRYREALIMKRVYKDLDSSISEIEKFLTLEDEDQPINQLHPILNNLVQDFEEAMTTLSDSQTDTMCIQTDLDRYRRKQRLVILDRSAGECERLLTDLDVKDALKQLCVIKEKLRVLTIELQECVPDMFLWLCHYNKKIGYKRFRAQEILYLEEDAKKFKLLTFFLKPPPVDGSSGSPVAVVSGYFWLAPISDSESSFQGLPDGFSIGLAAGRFLHYSESSEYQLRCYLFQGRSLIGSDDSGLSDPYVRIIFKEHTVESQVIEQTISPVWDQTLVLPNVVLYGDPNYYLENSPKIIVQVFDYDQVGKCEYLGQAEAYPTVKLATESYARPKFPPALRSWPLYRGANEDVGDVMACFELIQIAPDMQECPVLPMPKSGKSKGILPLPVYIKPVLRPYFLEVFFWGVRDLKPAGVLPIEEPSIEVECGGELVRSGPLKSVRKLPNFQSSRQKIKVLLPENHLYRPPVNIRCVDKKTFGRFVLVGTCTVPNIEQFMSKIDLYRLETAVSVEILPGDDGDTLSLAPQSDARLVKSLSASALETIHEIDKQSDWSSVVDVGRGGGGGGGGSGISDVVGRKASSASARVRTLQKEGILPIATQLSFEKPHAEMTKLKMPEEKILLREADQSEEDKANLLDWWSKYYASIRAAEETARMAASTTDLAILTIVDETPSSKPKKPKKKKKFFKGKAKAMAKFIKARPPPKSKVVLDDGQEEKIELLQIYPCELEHVSEFNNFHDCFYPFILSRGKKSFTETDEIDRAVGKFKGLVSIRRAKSSTSEETTDEHPIYRMPNDSVKVLVRVYVIQAKNLRPCDSSGKADPYLTLQCGNTKISDKQNRIYCQLNPVFGRMFEFEAAFPEEYELTLRVFDWDRLTADDLMGETKLDLEQRFYSKHRATCGLQAKYDTKGYSCWRDSLKPSQILIKLCRQFGLTGPFYGQASVTVGTKKFQIDDDDIDSPAESSTALSKMDNENLALYALRNWQDMPSVGYALVPEHVETRTLYLPDKPGMEQGSLEMWIDMFPMDGPPPPAPVDITPRTPNSYQLRVVIWDTKEVVLDDYNALTGQSSVDQYIKGFVVGPKVDLQQTDIHYRSLNGEGNFNWRFIFTFDYSEAEEKIVYKTKESVFSLTEHEEKLLPRISLQLWDADVITSDDYLGALSLDLTKIPTGAKSAKLCNLDVLQGKGNVNSSLTLLPFGKHKASEINLFKAKRTRGWWPFVKMEGKEQVITGKADIELQILTATEVEKKPAGAGRDPPDPMPAPQRPETSFAWFSSPLKMLKYDIWIGMRWRCFQIFVILLFVLFFALFIYQLPQSVAEKLVGG